MLKVVQLILVKEAPDHSLNHAVLIYHQWNWLPYKHNNLEGVNWVIFGLGYGLSPVGTKLLLEPVVT